MLDVLIGGLIVSALYMVPVLGFFLYMVLGAFGFGAVIYTILLATRGSSSAGAGAGTAAPAPECAGRWSRRQRQPAARHLP